MDAILLGSGLGAFEETFKIRQRIPYKNFSKTRIPEIEGHAREIILAEFEGIPFLILSGKYHYYEGLDKSALNAPFQFAVDNYPISSIIITASSGAFHPDIKVGEWQRVDQVLALQPIQSPPEKVLRTTRPKPIPKAFQNLRSSVYAFQTGPSLGTRAEYQFLNKMGAELVGMSIFPERNFLQSIGVNFHCLSLPVVNYHPINDCKEPGHEEVIRIAEKGSTDLAKLFKAYLK